MAKSSTANLLIVLFIALGSFNYGLNASITGPLLGQQSFFKYFDIQLEGPHSGYGNSILGAINGLFGAGGIFGCILVAILADRYGRVAAVQIACSIVVLSVVVQTAAVHISMLLLGRFLTGVGSGMLNVLVPIYQSEISSPSERGRNVGTHGFLLVSGYATASWIGLGTYFEPNENIQWRLCLALQAVPSILLLPGSIWMPESPRWLLMKGRLQEGLNVLQSLHTRSNQKHGMTPEEEFEQIRTQIALDETRDQSFSALWRTPSIRKRFLYAFFVQFMATSSGHLVINNYQVILYQTLGLTEWLPLLLFACYTSWAAFMNLLCSLILDRYGRVKIMTIGMVGGCVTIAIYTALVAKYKGTDNKAGNGAAVALMFCFITFFAGGVDATSYVYCSEIFPNHLRAQGVSVSIIALFCGYVIWTISAPTAFATIGWRYYMIFIFFPLFLAGIFAKFFPETNGLSLEEVAKLFGDEVAYPHLEGIQDEKVVSVEPEVVVSKDSNFQL